MSFAALSEVASSSVTLALGALFQPAEAAETAPAAAQTIDLDPVSLILNSSGPVFIVVWLLIVAAVLVWFIAVLKLLQLRRWSSAEKKFEGDAIKAQDADTLFDIARHHASLVGDRANAGLA